MKIGEKIMKNLAASRLLTAMKMVPAIPKATMTKLRAPIITL